MKRSTKALLHRPKNARPRRRQDGPPSTSGQAIEDGAGALRLASNLLRQHRADPASDRMNLNCVPPRRWSGSRSSRPVRPSSFR